jgi:hypothetical protein
MAVVTVDPRHSKKCPKSKEKNRAIQALQLPQMAAMGQERQEIREDS